MCLRGRDSALRGPHLVLQHQGAGVLRIVPFGSEIWDKALVLSRQHSALDANIRRISCSPVGSFVQAKAIQSIAASYDDVLPAV